MRLRYKTIFISLFTLLMVIILSAFIWVSTKVDKNKLDEASDNILSVFRHQMDTEEANALFLSVALSDNSALQNALMQEDEETGYRILIETLNKLKTYTFVKDIRTQVLTKDLDIFARSWDNSFAGMPLEGFRVDLQRIRKLRKPKVSIDPGRLLTIKATTPFKNGNKLIGYIEAIQTFDAITKRLRDRGIDLLVLMDDRFLDIATLMRENPTLGDYVVSNKNYNAFILKVLQTHSDKIAQKSHFFTKEYLHVVDVLRDSGGNKIGYYLLSVLRKNIAIYENKDKDISFFLRLSKDDLYDVVNTWEKQNGSYKSAYDKAFLNILDSINEEDRVAFEEEAKKILKSYTKEELINVILQHHYQREKKGQIK